MSSGKSRFPININQTTAAPATHNCNLPSFLPQKKSQSLFAHLPPDIDTLIANHFFSGLLLL